MKSSLILIFSLMTFVLTAQVNQVDSKGRKQGKWEKTYPNSIVFQYRGEFKDDKPVGKFVYYYESSKVKAIIKHNEIETGRSVAFFYHENGNVMSTGIYRNMKKDSTWINMTPSGRLSTVEEYKNDKLNGVRKVYFIPEDPDDKSQLVSAEMTYKDGELHGEYKEYFLNGRTKMRGTYENNKQVGAWEEFHVNGQRSATYRFKDGKKHGYAIAYDEMGKRLGEAFYYEGQRLEGKPLEDMLKQLKEKGISPYTMTTKQ